MSFAFYNEIEPFAVDWLNRLSLAGHIAEGYVDPRSIHALVPADLAGFTQAHFFAGVGVWSRALRLAGWPDDVCVWTGSCPCQPFSQAGAGGGFDDPRHLWPVWFPLIRECRPPVVFGEQVASPAGLAWLDLVRADLEGQGYAFAAADLCAAGIGAPHIRQRLYWTAIRLADRDGSSRRQGSALDGGRDPRGDAVAWPRSCGGGGFGGFGGLADDDDAGRCEQRRAGLCTDGNAPCGNDLDRCRAPCRMGDTVHAERGTEREYREDGSDRQNCGGEETHSLAGTSGEIRCAPRGVGLSEGAGWRQARRDAPGHSAADGIDARDRDGHAGTTRGFWGDAEWIYCLDGKWRPVRPGTFPLVDGAPARVGRLRAYGNAIVAPLAAEFIRTVMDLLGMPTREEAAGA